MKRVLLIAPEFVPRNLAGVLRPRLMASYLAEFGWEPVVLTVRPECYEGPLDEGLWGVLPSHLRVERVGAWPAAVCRRMGIGDIALRAQRAMRQRARQMVQAGEVDLVFASVQPGYGGLVGAWMKRRWGIPFVLDYQDPWVPSPNAPRPWLGRGAWAERIALWLEPGMVQCADALSAVSDMTLDGLRSRRLVRAGVPVEVIPIGADTADHALAARQVEARRQPTTNEWVISYVGTLTQRMLPATRTAMMAVGGLARRQPARRFKMQFIGTSAQPDGRDPHGLKQMAAECGVGDLFDLEPRRISYLDSLRAMQDADTLLLLGSIDPHYTASKIFPCWLAGRPVCGLFHEASTVNSLARELGGVGVVTYNEAHGPEERVAELAALLTEVTSRGLKALPERRESGFEPYSARSVARRFATLFDRVWAGANS